MTNTKTYILLKDLPDAKAGTEFIYDGRNCYDYHSESDAKQWYNKVYVENNKEWFKEKEQPTYEIPFEWTDKKVEAFAEWYRMAQGQEQFWGKDLLTHWLDNYQDKIKSEHDVPKPKSEINYNKEEIEEFKCLSIEEVLQCYKQVAPTGSPLYNSLVNNLYNLVKEKTKE